MSGPVRRVEYVRRGPWSVSRVICEVDDSGNMTFHEQEQSEVRWFAYHPSAEEREFAKSLLATGQKERAVFDAADAKPS